jgi:hypothetical protein
MAAPPPGPRPSRTLSATRTASAAGVLDHRPFRSDRDCPPDTAGDRCLWHVGGTAGEYEDAPSDGGGSHLNRRVRPVLGDHGLVGTSRMARASRVGDSKGEGDGTTITGPRPRSR